MRKRILTYFIVTLAAAITATTVIMTLLTYNMFEKRVTDDLSVDAKVISALMESEDAPQVIAEVQGALRVTIVAQDGTVLYDNRTDAAQMESHLDRPEIVQALKEGEGRDVRWKEARSITRCALRTGACCGRQRRPRASGAST